MREASTQHQLMIAAKQTRRAQVTDADTIHFLDTVIKDYQSRLAKVTLAIANTEQNIRGS